MKNITELLTEAKSKFKFEDEQLVYDGRQKCYAVLYTSENENPWNTKQGGDFARVSVKLVNANELPMWVGISDDGADFKALKKLNIGEMKSDFEEDEQTHGIVVVRMR